MFPKIRLALIFAKFAKNHGNKLLHVNNVSDLTRDLGLALEEQKNILSDPRRGSIMTAYDILPVILEVKIMSLMVAKKYDISTKGRPVIDILEDIIQKSDVRTAELGLVIDPASKIKETLEWTRDLFANPEIRDVLKVEMTDIEKIQKPKDVLKFFKQLAFRTVDEVNRINTFLARTKNAASNPPQDKKKRSGKGTTPKSGTA